MYNSKMSTVGLKTYSYRNKLRQSLEATSWQKCAWATTVLAAECVQGWAGRKNPTGATMLHVYCTKFLGSHETRAMAKFLQTAGLPSFNLVPIREYSSEISANRLSKNDTQDRFWLLRGYNALDSSHWDHWSLTKSYWGVHFQPSDQEAMHIVQDPLLFDAMLAQDWSRQEHFGESSPWAEMVAAYHAQWPDYSAMVQMMDSLNMSTFEDFRSTHLSLRTNYLAPQPVESFDLP